MRGTFKKLIVPNSEDSAVAGEALKLLRAECAKSAPATLQFRTRRGGLQKVRLPSIALKFLLEILKHTAAGKAASVVPTRKELTTQEAADILNVSRPFLISLVEKGEIPARMVGSHRRIPLLPLLQYKRKTDAVREDALAQMAAEAQELKLY